MERKLLAAARLARSLALLPFVYLAQVDVQFPISRAVAHKMPFVDLPNAHDDYASLWYITNSATGTVGGFHPSKATVLLLHPQFLDSAWLSAQLEDPRLSANYNLIALDARHSGQTTSRLNGKQDSWTDAADLAFALEVRALFYDIFPCTHHWMDG
jgi:hypothetical protein